MATGAGGMRTMTGTDRTERRTMNEREALRIALETRGRAEHKAQRSGMNRNRNLKQITTRSDERVAESQSSKQATAESRLPANKSKLSPSP